MVEASIPVDLSNAGQVFASFGFLEAAEVLLGEAEGGFDWSNEVDVRFRIRAGGEKNPFVVVLRFLANAEIQQYGPQSVVDAPKKKGKKSAGESNNDTASGDAPDYSDTFPSRTPDRMALPIRLAGRLNGQERLMYVSHWADASSRKNFKLYSGNRSAENIARAMLLGTHDKPKRGHAEGAVKTRGLRELWKTERGRLETRPFDVLTPIGGSFNFDPRGAWTGIDAGYSPNEQGHGVAASPVVEILAALGLEHARPDEFDTRQVRYAVWGSLLPPILARPVLGLARMAVLTRVFRFTLDLSGKNKVVTFAQEEPTP